MLKSVASKVGISVEELKAIIDKAEREGSDSEDSDVLYAGEQGNAGSWETWRDEPDIPPPDSEDEGDETDEFVATILDVLENPVADPTEAAATAVAAAEAGPNPMKTMGNRRCVAFPGHIPPILVVDSLAVKTVQSKLRQFGGRALLWLSATSCSQLYAGACCRDAVHAAIKAVGWLLVKGIPEGDDESDSEEDEDVSDAKLTQAQVDTLRYIAVTPGREKAIRSMEKLILREQFNSPVHMFNTHYSYTILQSFGQFVDFCKGRPWPEKADYLMAYTKMLGAYDVWMHDHEICWADSGGREFIRDLAKMWRDMLKQSDQTLKIDTAFTRPGMVALAEQFKKDVEGIEVAGQKLVFKLK